MLDTSAAILLRDGDPEVEEHVLQLGVNPFISILTRVELEGGVYRDPELSDVLRPRLNLLLAQVDQLPFEDEQAIAYAQIVARIGFSRTRIIDRMIAAQALVAGVALATLNPRDFRDIPDLVVEDWS